MPSFAASRRNSGTVIAPAPVPVPDVPPRCRARQADGDELGRERVRRRKAADEGEGVDDFSPEVSTWAKASAWTPSPKRSVALRPPDAARREPACSTPSTRVVQA